MKKLEYQLLWMIATILLECFAIVWCFLNERLFFVGILIFILGWTLKYLYDYLIGVNKKLIRFFDSIQYEDFNITFRNDNVRGQSFESLNTKMNEVIKSFSDIRAERESLLHFVQAIIQQLNVGVATFTTDGKIDLVNPAMLQILNLRQCKTFDDIRQSQPMIGQAAIDLLSGHNSLVKTNNNEYIISVKDLLLRAKKVRLLVVHNIKTELQHRELEAWQNLTKVLRHEIMNSVTPIVSMAQTMKDIIVHDFISSANDPSVKDLVTATDTIIHRSEGIMHFVNAYREFTSIPKPIIQKISIDVLMERVKILYSTKSLECQMMNTFDLNIDIDLIEQVLINLIKNAFESGISVEVKVKSFKRNNLSFIEVIDNGNGVVSDKRDQIFIPFYSTKEQGSGIGLSLSRQIMLMHNGTLHYEPNPEGQGSKFVLTFA